MRNFNRFGLHGALLLSVLAGLLTAVSAQAQQRYEQEYPAVGYGEHATTDRFSQLIRQIEAGETALEYDANGRGYLDSLLQALEIDPSSQVLVWSKSSLKQRFIKPSNPRSLFFNDEVYVGFVPGSRSLEIGAMDPVLGPVFFDLYQDPERKPLHKFETNRCLRCHDTYGMTGGGVPRFMMSTVLAGSDGEMVSHEINEITDTATPIKRRWGGWYVTGTHGDMAHMGNFIISDTAMLRSPDLLANGNVTSLEHLTDLSAYARPTSDIVALLVMEHQVEVQNRLTRLNFESRMLLAGNPQPGNAELDPLIDPLLDSLFMADEAALTATVAGSSGYQEYFEAQGPADSRGRSLRELDLQSRTFKYPFSYQIYSPAVKGLAEPVRNRLFTRIAAVLQGEDAQQYPHLNADRRAAISAILSETYPEVLK